MVISLGGRAETAQPLARPRSMIALQTLGKTRYRILCCLESQSAPVGHVESRSKK